MSAEKAEAPEFVIATTEFAPFRGGLGSYSESLARGMRARGVRVSVIAPAYPGLTGDSGDLEPLVRRYHLWPTGHLVSRRLVLWRSLRGALRGKDLPIVVATTYLYAQVAVLMALAMPGRFRLVVTVCGPELIGFRWWTPREWYRRLIVSLLVKKSETFICISKYTRTLALDAGVPLNRTSLVYVGVDTQFFTPDPQGARVRKDLLKGRAGPLVVTVARLERRKGHDTALRAVAMVRSRYPGITYAIVGVGDEEGRLRALVHELALEDSVVFCGPQTRDEVRRAYSAADVFLLPTRQEKRFVEAQGLVIIEAALCGAPVVVGRHGGPAEIVDDGVTGLLIDPEDPKACADALVRLFEDAGLRRQMVSSAQAAWPPRFGIAAMVDGTLAAAGLKT